MSEAAEQSMPVSVRSASTALLTAFNPLFGRDLLEFAETVREFEAAPAQPTTVAVVGMTPGEGRSTVAALLALTIAGYSQQRVLVIDAASNSPRPVTELLGGHRRQGRLPALLQAPGQVIARSRIRQATTPGTAVPVLALPDPHELTPPLLERTLQQLRHRADVVIIDTPAAPVSPIGPAAIGACDHSVLVARGDGDVERRLGALMALHRGAGHLPGSSVTAAVVVRGWSTPGFRPPPIPTSVVVRDEGLRRRRLHQLRISALSAGLALATELRHARSQAARAGSSVTR